ncbi:MAG: hypothetical protein IJW00_10225 [Clostridia bacterium]|nr:hypothetical protein [Clostridia bacterium]
MKYKHPAIHPRQQVLSFIACLSLVLTALAVPAQAVVDNSSPTVLLEDRVHAADTVKKLSPAEYLSYALRQPLTAEEQLWLESEGAEKLPASLALSYDPTVSHESITITFDENGDPTVIAHTYIGDTLGTVWTPVSVTYGQEDYSLTFDGQNTYEVTLDHDGDPLVTVKVNYEATLTPSAEDVNALINAAYNRGMELSETYDAYEKALKAHTDATNAYNAYRAALQQYRSDLALYNAYVAEKKVYDERLEKYKAYLAEMEIYEARMATYNAYLEEKAAYDKAYADYMSFVENPAAYEQKYLDYCEWLTKMETVRTQLTYIDSCFVRDKWGNVLNSTLNGPTVSTVVSNRDQLVAMGCNADDIANADAATAALTATLKDYPRDGEEAERYTYYINHYASFRDNVTLLYTSLSRLYSSDVVYDILNQTQKLDRYKQFLAQLYTLSCALEDNVTFDINWSISEDRLVDIMDKCYILKDVNAAAPMASFPAHMDEVTPPANMKIPTPPTVVEKPSAPLKVAEPTPPAMVAKPVLPTIVSAPGPKPTRPTFSACEEALYQVVKAGTLSQRSDVNQAASYPLSVSVDKSVSADRLSVASFYSHDRMTLLHRVVANEEGLVILPSNLPSRAPEAGNIYTFSGWKDTTGQLYPASQKQLTIHEDTAFFASFTAEKQTFTVTWNVDGVTQDTFHTYGDIPSFEAYKAPDEKYVYEFTGWSPAVTPVTGDMTYTAVFEARERIYEIQWVIGDSTESEEYTAGELPSYPTVPALPMDGRYRYIFKGWSPAITTATENKVYTAVFEAVDLLQGQDGGSVSQESGMITVTAPTDGTSEWVMPLSNAAQYAVEQNCGLTLTTQRYTLTFDSESVSKLAQSTARRIMIDETIDRSIRIRLLNDLGETLAVETDVQLTVSLAQDYVLRINDGEGKLLSNITDGIMTAVLSTNATYTLQKGYEIKTGLTIAGAEGDMGGLCRPDSDLADAGKPVTLLVTPAPGYGLNRVTVHDQNGTVIPTISQADGTLSFTMPQGKVAVVADFIPLTYTVTFIVNGNTISTATYYYGEMPAIPADPVLESNANYRYDFTGWTPTVTAVMGDATYQAIFLPVALNNQDSTIEESAIGIMELILIGAGSFFVTVATVLTPYIIVTFKKEKQNIENADEV